MTKKRLLAILAGVMAVITLMGATFAWWDFSQHRTNELTGGKDITKNDVTLVEDFDEPDDWQLDQEVTKKVSVLNTGEGDIFVRLQLKEYMEKSEITYTYSEDELAIDKDGKFLYNTDKAKFIAYLNGQKYTFKESDIVSYTTYPGTEQEFTAFYLKVTPDTVANGIGGKKLILNYTESNMTPMIPGTKKGSYTNTSDNSHADHQTDECKYPAHTWSKTGDCAVCGLGDPDKIHDYVKWLLGTEIITIDKWDGTPVAKWILDTNSAEGYAYWGETLKSGEETAKLLESVTLIKKPTGEFYYAIHVDLQAADKTDLVSKFTDIPENIKNSYLNGTFAITPDKKTVAQGGTVTFTATLGSEKTTDVTYSIAKGTAAGVGAKTNITSAGVMTIGPKQSKGTLIVTATNTKTNQTAKFTITVQ